jgi:catalase
VGFQRIWREAPTPADPGNNPTIARFSTMAGKPGAADAQRDVRGSAPEAN